ncbi:helicase C-terminal domain-containing protein [Methanococcus maripaludis]|uniref:Rad3-related DNA helicase n=2 Tax=Methanococcus maripaludis TaxID=39152 RepID=A0A7J9PGD5_METMI|nr:helicase C-terminal domain-containing protein [Methanococcus maripaludis]MBA2861767.1 Rad3-related DNA helicase [Methanococcus maripaludis]
MIPESPNMLEHIPEDFKYWRKYQQEKVEEILGHISNGKKIIVLNAPTGAGKSLYNISVGSILNSLNENNNAFVLTSTKMLQNQYSDEFPEVRVIKGRANYPCKSWEWLYNLRKNEDAKKGKKTEEYKAKTFEDCYKIAKNTKCNFEGVCEYKLAKKEALESTFACMNMAYFILAVPNEEVGFENRTLCIIDEAHNIEDTLMNHYTIEITKKRVEKLRKSLKEQKEVNFPKEKWNGILPVNIYFKDIINYAVDAAFENIYEGEAELLNFLKKTVYSDIKIILDKQLVSKDIFFMKVKNQNNLINMSNLERKQKLINYSKMFLPSNYIDLSESETTRFMDSIEKYQKRIKNAINLFDDLYKIEEIQESGEMGAKWIPTHVERNYGKNVGTYLEKIILKPIDVKDLKEELFDQAEFYILSSATLSKQHMKDLGFSEKDYAVVSVPASFPVKNRPLKIINEFNMKYEYLNKKDYFKKTVEKLDLILSNHKNERGIIHVSSNKLMKDIFKNSIHKNRMIKVTSNGNLSEGIESIDSGLYYHEKNNNSVLISPSLHTGVDFKDDKARFQIIFKVPFLAGDEQVTARRKKDPNWYFGKAVTQMIQSYGRTTRSVNDYSITYILDKRALHYLKNDNFTPNWVKEAVIKYNTVEDALIDKSL